MDKRLAQPKDTHPKEEHHPDRHFQVTWDEFHRHSRALAWRMHDAGKHKKWNVVLGVSRGGLVPATIMAREFGLRIVESISVESYRDFTTQGELRILKNISEDVRKLLRSGGENMLIVDDLVDTGKTFDKLRDMFPAAHYAAIYSKPRGVHAVQDHLIQVSQETWIYLPWDTHNLTLEYMPPMVQPEGSLD